MVVKCQGKTGFTLDYTPTAGEGHDVGKFPWVTMLENSTQGYRI